MAGQCDLTVKTKGFEVILWRKTPKVSTKRTSFKTKLFSFFGIFVESRKKPLGSRAYPTNRPVGYAFRIHLHFINTGFLCHQHIRSSINSHHNVVMYRFKTDCLVCFKLIRMGIVIFLNLKLIDRSIVISLPFYMCKTSLWTHMPPYVLENSISFCWSVLRWSSLGRCSLSLSNGRYIR